MNLRWLVILSAATCPIAAPDDSSADSVSAVLQVSERYEISFPHKTKVEMANLVAGNPRIVRDVAGAVRSPPHDMTEQTRGQLVRALGDMGRYAAPAVPVLMDLAFGRNERLKSTAYDALVKIGAPAASALAEVVKEGQPQDRKAAMSLLTRMGPGAQPAIPVLLQRMQEEADDRAMLEAAWIIASGDPRALKGPQGQIVVPRVVALSESSNLELASSAVVLLGPFGVSLDLAMPIIVRHPIRVKQASKDPSTAWIQALASAYALHGLGEPAVPKLIEFLNDSDPAMRASAAALLETPKLAIAGHVNALVDALNQDDPGVRAKVARVLGNIGPAAQAALPALRRLNDDRDEQVRRAARHASTRICGSQKIDNGT